MSFERILAVFRAIEQGRVPGASAALVLIRLADRAGAGGLCWPGLDRIASDTGLGRRTVIRALDQLAEAGLIERHPRPGGSTLYRVLPEAGRQEDDDTPQGARMAPLGCQNDTPRVPRWHPNLSGNRSNETKKETTTTSQCHFDTTDTTPPKPRAAGLIEQELAKMRAFLR